MKESRYNILFEHNSENFAFNSFTTALNKVNSDFVNILNSIDKISEEEKNKHKDLIDNMKREGYLVDKDFDEFKALQFYNMSKKFSSETLSLTIVPTLSCNFACPYCYENVKKGTMSRSVQDQLLEFAEKNLKNKKYLNIIWFGGEPLLAKKIIYDLSSKLIVMCERMGVKYSARMVSNFYLADEETIINLKKYKVNQVQVTIDGSEKSHNARRKLKYGDEPTFNRIIDNIVKSKKIGLPIIIRVNADKTNINFVEELADVLVKHGLKDIYTYLAHTTIFDEKYPTKFISNCFITGDFAIQSAEFTKLLIKKGFNKNIVNIMYPKAIPFHCSAQCLNAFIIGPGGELYKCENEVGETKKCVGDIFNFSDEKGLKPMQALKNMNWLLSSPFEEKKCKNCNILPICMGGCLNFKRKILEPYCMPWKYNIINILKLKCDNYNSTKQENNIQISVC